MHLSNTPAVIGAVHPGQLLFTNAPNGIPVKPMVWEFRAGERLGPLSGWSTRAAAEEAIVALTDGSAGAAVLAREGASWMGYRLRSGGPFEPGAEIALSRPLRAQHGSPLFWRHDAIVAVYDDGFAERYA